MIVMIISSDSLIRLNEQLKQRTPRPISLANIIENPRLPTLRYTQLSVRRSSHA